MVFKLYIQAKLIQIPNIYNFKIIIEEAYICMPLPITVYETRSLTSCIQKFTGILQSYNTNFFNIVPGTYRRKSPFDIEALIEGKDEKINKVVMDVITL